MKLPSVLEAARSRWIDKNTVLENFSLAANPICGQCKWRERTFSELFSFHNDSALWTQYSQFLRAQYKVGAVAQDTVTGLLGDNPDFQAQHPAGPDPKNCIVYTVFAIIQGPVHSVHGFSGLSTQSAQWPTSMK